MSLTVHNHVDKDSMLHPIHRSPPTRHSRSREGPVTLKATPIIAVSSFAMKGDEEKARASGSDHYITES